MYDFSKQRMFLQLYGVSFLIVLAIAWINYGTDLRYNLFFSNDINYLLKFSHFRKKFEQASEKKVNS